jgi:uncharacterized protein DUF6941
MPSETGGPWLQMAVICEKVLQEQDGVLSVIRVIDRVNVTAQGIATPEEMPPTNLTFPAVITLKSGFCRGRYDLKIVPITPSGKSLKENIVSVQLDGEDRGMNILINLVFQANEEGLYWFEIYVQNQLLTRMPLRVVYQRLTLQHQPPM